MKTSIVFYAMLSLTGLCFAQATAPPMDSLPSGPLVITRMIDRAQWTVEYTYTDALKPGAESPLLVHFRELAKTDPTIAKQMANPNFVATLTPTRPLKNVFTLTGAIWHSEQALEQNLTAETWCDGHIIAERRPSNSEFVVSLVDSAGQVGFPEFSWINRDNFKGIEIENGQRCMTFKAEIDPVQLDHASSNITGDTTVPATAHINLKTRLPVSLQFGVENREYVFLAPPSADLEVPPELAAEGKALLARIQKLSPTPTGR